MLRSRTVPLDYFGVAGDTIIRVLLDQSSNKRARKIAFNNMERLGKAAGLVPKDGEQIRFALTINQAGEQQLEFMFLEKNTQGDIHAKG